MTLPGGRSLLGRSLPAERVHRPLDFDAFAGMDLHRPFDDVAIDCDLEFLRHAELTIRPVRAPHLTGDQSKQPGCLTFHLAAQLLNRGLAWGGHLPRAEDGIA